MAGEYPLNMRISMDKLELDARVARLERWLAVSVILPGIALLAVIGLLLFARIDLTSPPAIATPLPAVAPMETKTTVTITEPPIIPISTLENDLKALHDLQLQGVISLSDFNAKKAQFLTKPIVVGNLSESLQVAKKLMTDGVITLREFEQIKKKILGIDG